WGIGDHGRDGRRRGGCRGHRNLQAEAAASAAVAAELQVVRLASDDRCPKQGGPVGAGVVVTREGRERRSAVKRQDGIEAATSRGRGERSARGRNEPVPHCGADLPARLLLTRISIRRRGGTGNS